MRREVGRAVEDFVAFGATVLDVDYPGAAVLGQAEGVFVEFSAEPADVISDVVFDLRQFRFRLLGYFDYVEGGVYVAFAYH